MKIIKSFNTINLCIKPDCILSGFLYNVVMNYTYKSFAFICASLVAVTEEFVARTDSSFEMFEDIIYQRLEKSSYEDNETLGKLYYVWSLVKELIEENKSLLKFGYAQVIKDILYSDIEADIDDSFHYGILTKLNDLLNGDKELFKTFFDMGADRCLLELMDDAERNMGKE